MISDKGWVIAFFLLFINLIWGNKVGHSVSWKFLYYSMIYILHFRILYLWDRLRYRLKTKEWVFEKKYSSILYTIYHAEFFQFILTALLYWKLISNKDLYDYFSRIFLMKFWNDSQEEQAGVDPISARFPVSTPTDVDADARRFAFRPPRYRRGPGGGPGTNLIPTGRQDSLQGDQED